MIFSIIVNVSILRTEYHLQYRREPQVEKQWNRTTPLLTNSLKV